MATVAAPYDAVEAEPSPAAGSIGRLYAEERASHLLNALVNGPRAWLSAGELADALGWSAGAVEAAIEAGASIGWLAWWEDCPSGPSATLSPQSAAMLGVGIGPDGKFHPELSPACDGNYRVSGPPGRRAVPAAEGGEYEDGGTFGWCADPKAIDPADAAEKAERLALLAASPYVRRLLAGTAMPARIVGIRPIWPAMVVAGVCPGCGAGPTAFDTVCVICHRSGIDPLIGRRAGR